MPSEVPSHRPSDYTTLHSPEELAQRFQYMLAYVRLVIDAGCPTSDGRLSAKMISDWLLEHYDDVRELAGLAPLPSLQVLDEGERASVQALNVMRTGLEYLESRSVRPDVKQAVQSVLRKLFR